MSRPLRIEYNGAFYHILSRGERKEAIFKCDRDKTVFLKKIGETATKYQLLVHAYVLMNNHYHLLIETPLGNLSKAMHYLNASYGNWFRTKYKINGSVFQGRYKAVLVDKNEYLKALSAYIHLNPVRAGIVDMPSEYSYSSCAYYCLKIKKPAFLQTDDLLAMFHGRNEYNDYISLFRKEGTQIGQNEVYGKNSIAGNKDFIRKSLLKLKKTERKMDEREQPEYRNSNLLSADDMKKIMVIDLKITEADIWNRKRGNAYRKLLVYGLCRYTGLNLKDIGLIMDMDYAAVSTMKSRFEKEINTNKQYRKLAEQLKKEVMNRRVFKG